MRPDRISTTVTSTVVLGGPAYASPLTVTSTGVINPSGYGDAAIYAATAGVVLKNHGIIQGAAGAYPTAPGQPVAGGIGVDLTAGGSIVNTGMIKGGIAGNATNSPPGAGGDGVAIAGGQVSNSGTIIGGAGYYAYKPNANASNGGDGVLFTAAGTLVNHGLIQAGEGGYGSTGPGGNGGIGVAFTAGGSLSNSGTIAGGYGPTGYGHDPSGIGGAGVLFATAGTLTNHGTILGGADAGPAALGGPGHGADGVDLASGSVLANFGVITAGYGGYNFDSRSAGYGGTGVSATNSTLDNRGMITGGEAGGGGATGGVGILLQGGQLHNAGHITGGNGGYSYESTGGTGGIGIVASAAATIVNAASGTIAGGQGGPARYGAGGGTGGVGVALSAGAALSNQGTIHGGAGAYYSGQNGNVGTGGIAVVAGATTIVDNAGIIVGGAGGLSQPLGNGKYYTTAPGGAGVDLTGATLRNTGAITGGAGGMVAASDVNPFGAGYGGTGGAGVIAGAGSAAFNTGTITGGIGGTGPGFVAYGGNGGAGVYLNGGRLTNAGTIAGGAAGIGTKTTGTAGDAVQFGTLASTLVLDPGAVFDGQVAANATVNDVLLLAGKGGTLAGLGTAFTNVTTLAERPNADWTISGNATLVAGGELIIRQNAALTLDGALSGAATIRLDAGATLTADAGLSATTIRFANGGNETLALNSTDPVAGTLSGFRLTDTIDIASTITTVSAMGGTVILLDGHSAIETLTLDGNFTAAQFALTPDDHGGTDITLIASAQSAAPLHAAPAFAASPHDGFTPFALFGWHAHVG
jgi:autotransporter family porin